MTPVKLTASTYDQEDVDIPVTDALLQTEAGAEASAEADAEQHIDGPASQNSRTINIVNNNRNMSGVAPIGGMGGGGGMPGLGNMG